MTLPGFLLFAATYTLAVASPGPGIAALVAQVLARGVAGIWAFIAGMVLGDLIWLTFAAAGLAVVAQHFASLLLAIRLAGAAYLLFIAWKLWTRPAGVVSQGAEMGREPPLRLFLSALSMTLGNPKVIVFFMALLPAIVDLPSLTPGNFGIIALLSAFILSSVMSAYALAAGQARKMFTSARAMQRLNRTTGAVMAGVAVAIAVK